MKKTIILAGALLSGCGLTTEINPDDDYLKVSVVFYTNFGEKITNTYVNITDVQTDTSAKILHLTAKGGKKYRVNYLGGEVTIE